MDGFDIEFTILTDVARPCGDIWDTQELVVKAGDKCRLTSLEMSYLAAWAHIGRFGVHFTSFFRMSI
jgi:hypothetical protein